MDVRVYWTTLDDDRHELWSTSYCLYAYLHPERNWLFYIGKADYSTVRRRLHGDHKSEVFGAIWRRYEVDQVRVLHGELALEDGRNRTSTLLGDVESLLIMRLQPFANIANTNSRFTRPGMRVFCEGDWPFKRRRFMTTGREALQARCAR